MRRVMREREREREKEKEGEREERERGLVKRVEYQLI